MTKYVEALSAGEGYLYLSYKGERYRLGRIKVVDGPAEVICNGVTGLPSVVYRQSNNTITAIHSNRYYAPVSIGINQKYNFTIPTTVVAEYGTSDTLISLTPSNFKGTMSITSSDTSVLAVSNNTTLNAKSEGKSVITIKDGTNVVCKNTVKVINNTGTKEIAAPGLECYIKDTDIAYLNGNSIVGKANGNTCMMLKFNNMEIKLFDIKVGSSNHNFIRNMSFVEIVK